MDSVHQHFRGVYSVFLWNVGMNVLDYRMQYHGRSQYEYSPWNSRFSQNSVPWDVMACSSLADICCCQGRRGQHIPHEMSVRFLQKYLESHFKWQRYSRIHSILYISILTFVLPLALLYAWIRFTMAWDVSFI